MAWLDKPAVFKFIFDALHDAIELLLAPAQIQINLLGLQTGVLADVLAQLIGVLALYGGHAAISQALTGSQFVNIGPR